MGLISRLRGLAARGLTRLAGFAGGYYTWLGGMAVAALLLTLFALPLLSGLPLPWNVNLDGLTGKEAAVAKAAATTAAWDFVLKLAGGVAVLTGLFIAWRRSEAAMQSQITDRFTRAIDQIGATNPADHLPHVVVRMGGIYAIDQIGATNPADHLPHVVVRMGGIYALEQIAKDNPDKYHWTVMEVLTGYLRERAGIPDKPAKKKSGKNPKETKIAPVSLPPKDVQAAITVIGRRNAKRDPRDEQLDFTRTMLNRANFFRAKLEGADFEDAELKEANFFRAKLEGADFENAKLEGADFDNANLERAYFINAKLEGAKFRNAKLEGANFREAAGFTKAQLCSAKSFDKTTVLPKHLEA